jgi:Histone deacetylation protein Rxt3
MYLTSEIRAEITSRKAVWGTDIYTDDSDVIAACIHQGWFRGEWDEEVDTSLLGLELKDGPPDSPKKFLTEPPARGPMLALPDHDCHITILVLPLLEKYSSTTRFGLRSREWGGDHDGFKGVHDGLSFMVMSVRWVDGETDDGGRVMKRKALLETEMEDEKEDEAFFTRIAVNGHTNENNVEVPESFERGDPEGFPRDIKGVGTRSWFKAKAATRSKKTAVVEKEKETEKMEDVQIESRAEDVMMDTEEKAPEKEEAKDEPKEKSVIERVTERMIENANAHANLSTRT